MTHPSAARTSALAPDDPIARRTLELKRFVDDHNRWPSTIGASAAERRLGAWLAQLRRAAKGAGPRAKTFTEARRAYLDHEVPGWEGLDWDGLFRRNAYDLAAFMSARGRVPSARSDDAEERRLASFRHNQVSELHGVAKMKTRVNRIGYLDHHAPGWRPGAATWQSSEA